MSRFLTFTLAALLALLATSGCVTVREQFDGYDSGHVWTAMKAVAHSPEYDDRHAITNEVWQAEDEARLEVYRQTLRYVHQPRSKPRTEQRDWRFQIVLDGSDPPTATFVSRGWSVPAHARAEAKHYFDEVWQMLGPRRTIEPIEEPIEETTEDDDAPQADDQADAEAPSSDEAPTEDAERDSAAPVDVDDLLPNG